MKKILKISAVFIVLLIVVAAIPAFIPDEEYTAGVQQWLREGSHHEELPIEVNRFNALAGFYVEADKDMVTEGGRLIAEVNVQFSDSVEEPYFNDYWDSPPLRSGGRLSGGTSDAFKQDPAQWLLDNQDEYSKLISGNQIFLDRFRKLIAMKQYSHTMKLDINAPMVSYRYFLDVKRLNNLTIIHEFMNANKQDAIDSLQQSIASSKLMLTQSVIIIDKMIAVESLKIDLLTYSSLLDLSSSDVVSTLQLTNLQGDERSMLRAVMGEFAYMSTALDIEGSKKFGANYVESGVLEDFVLKFYLKRKKMENYARRNIWLPFLEMSDHSLASREVSNISAFNENELTWWQIYQDPISYIFSAIAVPAYDDYIARLDHVDAMITLLNLKASIYSNNVASDNVGDYVASLNAGMNAAYKDSRFSWDREKQELSFEVPDYFDENIPRVKLY